MNINPIQCGEDYSTTFNSGTAKNVYSTSNASPIVVTIPNHGYANGETKYLDGCQDLAADGTWVIANVTTNTFTLTGTTGLLNGGAIGKCTTPYDITGKTVRATARNGSVLGAVLSQSFIITVNNYLLCDITLSMSHADTKALQTAGVTQVYTDVWADDIPLVVGVVIPVLSSATIF